MSEMKLERLSVEEQADGVTYVSFVAGRADGLASRELYEAAIAMVDRPPVKLLVDLSGVPFVSSGAMGMLISIRKKYMQHGGQLHIAAPDPMIRQSFRIANLHILLPLFETPEAARAAFKS